MQTHQGYVLDQLYAYSFYKEMQPLWLSTVAAFAGWQAPSVEQPFRYCELGSGLGVNLLVAATLYPHGHFVGVDMNPQHIALCRNAAAELGLSNLQFELADFAGFASAEQEGYDWIVCHGTWSWVSKQTQQQLLALVLQQLKPGGIFYLHYMCQPGSNAMQPLQQLMLQVAQSQPQLDSAQNAGQAMQLIQALVQAGVFHDQPDLARHLTALGQRNTHYLAHEFLTEHWQPETSAAVHQRLQTAGLTYLGSASLFDNIEALSVPGQAQAVLQGLTDPGLRESVKDLARWQRQRMDLFGHNQPLSAAQQNKQLAQIRLAALPGCPAAGPVQFQTPIGPIDGPAQLLNPALQRLKQGECSLVELLKLPAYQGQQELVLQLVQLLIYGGLCHPVLPELCWPEQGVVDQLNQWLLVQKLTLKAERSCGCAIVQGRG